MTMEGRIKRVMIACVTFETVKVSDPVAYWGTNRIYLIHYIRDPQDPRVSVYQEFYDRTCELIRQASPDAEIVDINRDVSDFTVMLRTVASIICQERAAPGEPPEIFVNIASGPAEYTAAAAIASMMADGVRPFFVKAETFQVPREKIREVYYENGKPVGMTRAVKRVECLPDFTIETPDERLVRALRVFAARSDAGQAVTAQQMAAALKAAGCWSRRSEGANANNEAVYYQRSYVDSWLAAGWVERKGGRRSGYAVSGKGRVILATFFVNGDLVAG